MNKQFMKGNEAIIYGALLGGSTHFFGYPITPASEIAHAAAKLYPLTGRHFLQAESEVSVINMLYGASSAGARVMTASSGPGISLMAEGISYMAGAQLPCVIVNIQRAGPGLGNIWPEQSDYNASVKGGGHGNFKNIVFAPNSVQEMCNFTYKAFEIAEKYRMIVLILSDAYIGQMMEPVSLPTKVLHAPRHDWALYADKKSRSNLITSIYMNQNILHDLNTKLQQKYKSVEDDLVDYEEVQTKDADYLFVSYGISARICLTALNVLRKNGKKIGLLRLKTLFPFPKKRLFELSKSIKKCFVVELSNGQMAEDVELAIKSSIPISLFNWFGGKVPSVGDIVEQSEKEMEN